MLAFLVIIAVFPSMIIGQVVVTDEADVSASPEIDEFDEFVEEDIEPPSPEDLAIDAKTAAKFKEICLGSLGNCWVTLKRNKPYLTEERQREVCLMEAQGWDLCDTITNDDLEAAIQEAKQLKARNVQSSSQEETRKKKLQKRKQAVMFRQRKEMQKSSSRNTRAVSTATHPRK